MTRIFQMELINIREGDYSESAMIGPRLNQTHVLKLPQLIIGVKADAPIL